MARRSQNLSTFERSVKMVTEWRIQLQCIFNIKDEIIMFSIIIDISLVQSPLLDQRPCQPPELLVCYPPVNFPHFWEHVHPI